MPRPKIFEGGYLGLRLPKDMDLRLRAAALETGRSLSDLARETLARTWGARPREDREAQSG